MICWHCKHATQRGFDSALICKEPGAPGFPPGMAFPPDTLSRCPAFEDHPYMDKKEHNTVAAIYAAYEDREAATDPRQYLGASVIGHNCAKYLWLSFRLAKREAFEGRMLRLFERGHREETRFVEDLRAIGVTVHDTDPQGGQWAVSAFGGHFRGHMDGACVGLPEAKAVWHVLEFKTHSAKSFAKLEKEGVIVSKPMHYAQMQVYMLLTGLEKALYLAVNKDTDALYSERFSLDKDVAQRLIDRASSIIFAAEPPLPLSKDPAYFECKWCHMHPICHGTDVPAVTCRSCAHATPQESGEWGCEHYKMAPIPFATQQTGCDAHRYIPVLLASFADFLGGNQDTNTVSYKNTLNGGHFTQGDGSATDFTSIEIHAAQDKRAIGDPGFAALRKTFDAKAAQ
jgi:hypothetical protein